MFDDKTLNNLYRYGHALCGQSDLAYDLVHDAIEKMLQKTFILNKVAYAKKTMRNKYFDLMKSKATTTSSLLEEENLTSDWNKFRDQKLDLETLLKKIPDLDRELLYLWAVEEYTTAEMSTLLDIPKGTITSRLKRLRDKLQQEENNE